MVVVDSSVIIHFARSGKLELLEKYFKKIKITPEIGKEILQEGKAGEEQIKKSIGKWIVVKKIEIKRKSDILSNADMELIALAGKEKDFILTNDNEIVSFASAAKIETMWATTFLVGCIKKNILTKQQGKKILYDLIKSGMYLRTDTYAEITRQIESL
ncbi:MAG: hypothetical protein HY514_02600 [Candidatus Aenigmarchaeota archaeon]|nr:hypothetical protein [Candidatus Aenigmarchaeota archaeon]